MHKINLDRKIIFLLIKWWCKKNNIKIVKEDHRENKTVIHILNKSEFTELVITEDGKIMVTGEKDKSEAEKIFSNLLSEFIGSKKMKDLEKFNDIRNGVIFIDLTNVFHWQDKLGWSFHPKKLVKFLSTINGISEVRVYYGIKDNNNGKSENLLRMLRQTGAVTKTKNVKMIKKLLKKDGPNIFLKQQRLELFSDQAHEIVESLVTQLEQDGQLVWEEPKCNFDVEIALDMVDATERSENIILFSGDSDFLEAVKRVKLKGRKIIVCCTSGCLSEELRDNNDEYFDFKIFRPLVERPKIEKSAEEADFRTNS